MRDIYNHTYYENNKDILKEKRLIYVELQKLLKLIEHIRKMIYTYFKQKKRKRKERQININDISLILDLN